MIVHTLEIFDRELARYQEKLHSDLKLDKFSSRSLATKIYEDVMALSSEKKQLIVQSSPVPPRDRLHQVEQSIAFNAACSPELFERTPGVAYAHTVTLSYISVVYLAESLFDALYKSLASGLPGKKCADYLRKNPARAFRNALAHGHWRFRSDGTAIEFWARKGSGDNEPMCQYEVLQRNLLFWFSLGRAVGYAALAGVVNANEDQ